MGRVKVVSFDAEGTLVTPDLSRAVWYEDIPALYVGRNGISFEEARAIIEKAYREVGDHRVEWYDINYWFQRFQLGDYRRVLERNRHKASHYSEVIPVLSSLGREYTLIVMTSTTREFLDYMLAGIEGYFARVFAVISDYRQIKSPFLYRTVCQEMNILPDQMAHIGDSWRFDYLAAKEAGVEAFYLSRDGKSGEGRSLTSLKDLEAKLLGVWNSS